MIELGGKRLCENCFSEVEGKSCTQCGYNAETSESDPLTLKPGSILRGKYIVGKCLGKGGFGITYLAYDTNAEKKVAIKEYYPMGLALRTIGNPTVQVSNSKNAAMFRDGAEKFYEEAKLVSRFNGNPNIVSVYEFFYENDTVYFSMEYLEGITLNDYVSQKGNLSLTQALFIADNIANALMAAHSASVLHRDISPDNIMLCSSGEVKLIDFGAARQVIAEQSQSFSVILKPGFAPLEQYQKKGHQGAWTDIYSLGASIFYGMTGIIPEDPMSRLEDETTFDENRYNIFPELWNVIVKATMLKIPDRYPDIFEMRKALNSINAARQPIFVPENNIPQEEPGFHTAVPFGQTSAVSQPSIRPTAGAVPHTANATVQGEIPPKKPGFFAAHKKLVIGAVSGLAAVAAAAVILVTVLHPGKKPYENENAGGAIVAADPVRTMITVGSATFPIDAEYIELKNADIADADLSELKYLKNLKTLILDDNYIQSLSFVEDITSLECLSVNNNLVSDLSPLKNLPDLVEFHASDNPITDISVFGDKTKMKKLWLCDTKITDISAIKKCTRLVELGLSNCNIDGEISALEDMSDLEQVYIAGCGVGTIQSLSGKPNLGIIDLANNMIIDVSPLSLCKEIEYLDVSNNWLSEQSIQTFTGLKITGDVYVQGNGFTEEQSYEIDRLLPPEAIVWWL